jgi:hypothetical protein
VYRVTQKDFYERPYASMRAPVVARQICKRYSSSCHVFISRGGPTAWPPRSPDSTPLDFFEWGFIKDVVYRIKFRDLADLRQRIIEAVRLIKPHMLINMWKELEYRLDICRATTGAHIEVYGRS